ncbi:MAG TPA: hypothetical protein VLW75_11000 [Rhizomicrobium sp.]|nr:hypothetical protein [Rhizomicrobium sp.]
MRALIALLALGLGLLPLSALAETPARGFHPLIHPMPAPQSSQSEPSSQPAASQSSGGCPAHYQSGGLCWGSVTFTNYLNASYNCALDGGRLPTLGELFAFRTRPGADEKGIECSSTFDMGTAMLWCVGDGGTLSGVHYDQQTEPLGKLPAEFRCVTYLKS